MKIAKQTTFLISSTEKLYLRLVYASDYFQHFPLVIKYKSSKHYIISNVPFRLEVKGRDLWEKQEEGELNDLLITLLIEMRNKLQEKLIQDYKIYWFWSKITALFQKKISLSSPYLLFYLKNNLIFCRDRYVCTDHACEPCYLYIPQPLIKEIPKRNHNDNGYLGFLYYYEKIASLYYIWNLSAHLKAYLKHCIFCNINQTCRYPTYRNLQPILSSPIPFHLLTMDFIIALPLLWTEKNNLIIVTCKFTKRILLILGHSKWGVAKWALALLEQLQL